MPLIVATTDIRSSKVSQFQSSPSSAAKPNAEVAWWISDASEQYRIGAKVHILPHPEHELVGSFPAARLDKGGQDSNSEFGWEELRRRIFNEVMGDAMRASFCRPNPGGALGDYEESKVWVNRLPKEEEAKGDLEKERLVEEALRNFALIVVEPLRVDLLELGIEPHRKTVWERVENGEWSENLVVP